MVDNLSEKVFDEPAYYDYYRQLLKDVPEEEMIGAWRELCKQDLFFLSEFVLRNKESESIPFIKEFQGEMCRWLERPGQRKMLMAPRGHGKSTVANRNYVVWRLINDPNTTILIISATLDNAKKKLKAIQEVFEKNKFFKELFPELIPTSFGDGWTQTQMNIPRTSTDPESSVEVQGYEGELTSRHYKIILFDDVVGKENSTSREQIQKVVNFYTQSLQLLKKPGGEMLVIGTMWSYADLHNHIIENLYEEFDIYVRSVWAEDRFVRIGDGGKYQWITTANTKTPLYPEMFGREDLETLKKEITADPLQGMSIWMAQYELKIIDEKSAIFPRNVVNEKNCWFTDEDLYEKKLAFSLSCDPAVSEAKEADETVFIVRAVDDAGYWYVIDVFGERGMREEAIVNKYVQLLVDYPIDLATIETISFQRNLQYAIEKRCQEDKIFFPYQKLPSGFLQGSKNNSDLKIRGLASPYTTGKIKFRKGDLQTELLLDQMWRFPRSSKDDRCLVGDTLIATEYGDKKIKDIIVGDRVITPLGLKKVVASGKTGEDLVVENRGLVGTLNHPVFFNNKFDNLVAISHNDCVSNLNLKTQILWAYKKLLYLMERNTSSWGGKKDIISINQQQLRGRSVLRDCMWQFGNFIIKRKSRKAMLFIIKILILLITTLKIWSVYRMSSMVKSIGKLGVKAVRIELERICREPQKKLKSGTPQKPVISGIKSIIRTVLQKLLGMNQYVCIVARKYLAPERLLLNTAPTHAKWYTGIETESCVRKKSVLSAEKNLWVSNIGTQDSVIGGVQQSIENVEKKEVYNIEVEDAHCYYANGILVGNCDALSQHLWLPVIATRVWKSNEIKTEPSELDRYGHKKNNERTGLYI